MSQETPALAAPALDFVLDGDARAARDRAATRRRRGGARRQRDRRAACGACAAIDGYGATARAAALLARSRLLDRRTWRRPVADFSGGWRMRLNLARALDEPRRPAAARRADQPPRPRRHRLVRALAGGLPRHAAPDLARPRPARRLHDPHRAHRRTAALRSTREITPPSSGSAPTGSPCSRRCMRSNSARIAAIESFVERFRAKATKARQAQSRLKALGTHGAASRPRTSTRRFEFEFPAPPPLRGSAAHARRRWRRPIGERRVLGDVQLAAAHGLASGAARPERRRQVHADAPARGRGRPR